MITNLIVPILGLLLTPDPARARRWQHTAQGFAAVARDFAHLPGYEAEAKVLQHRAAEAYAAARHHMGMTE